MKISNLLWVLALASAVAACNNWTDQPPVEGIVKPPVGGTGGTAGTGGTGGTGGVGGDAGNSIENVFGGSGSDMITGDQEGNILGDGPGDAGPSPF